MCAFVCGLCVCTVRVCTVCVLCVCARAHLCLCTASSSLRPVSLCVCVVCDVCAGMPWLWVQPTPVLRYMLPLEGRAAVAAFLDKSLYQSLSPAPLMYIACPLSLCCPRQFEYTAEDSVIFAHSLAELQEGLRLLERTGDGQG